MAFSRTLEVLPLHHSVVPLRSGDVWKAAGTVFDAFLEDPFNEYLRADQKPSPTAHKLINATFFTAWIRTTKVVLTINAGAAVVVATPPEASPRTPVNMIAELITTLLTVTAKKLGVKEARKRNKEFARKSGAVISETLGDRVREMMYVNLLATDPKYQGQGYGGALLESITSIADIMDQSLWLHSSNINNTEFYRLHGFETVGEVCLGDDNPEWHGKPVIIPIMVREPMKRFAIKEGS